MNGRSEQQLSTEELGWLGNAPDIGDKGNRVRAEAGPTAFSFGPFRIVPHARLLERDGLPVPLSSRAFDVLCLLVSRAGEVVSKGELIARAWPDLTVEESCLRFHMTMLRRALGDGQGGERYVVNIPGRGYCFVASVRREALPLKQNHANRPNPVPSARGDWQLAAV
jgi:DNA-binding winged helix-turn-helix (wHTH) protein